MFQGKGSGSIVGRVKVQQDYLEGGMAFSVIIFTMICSSSPLWPDLLTTSYKGEALKSFSSPDRIWCTITAVLLIRLCVKHGFASSSKEKKEGVQVSCKEDHSTRLCDTPKLAVPRVKYWGSHTQLFRKQTKFLALPSNLIQPLLKANGYKGAERAWKLCSILWELGNLCSPHLTIENNLEKGKGQWETPCSCPPFLIKIRC